MECDADSVFSAPHNAAGKARAVCDKIEVVGDADWAYVELRARVRSVSNHAREGAPNSIVPAFKTRRRGALRCSMATGHLVSKRSDFVNRSRYQRGSQPRR
jgi:hypothetical protein